MWVCICLNILKHKRIVIVFLVVSRVIPCPMPMCLFFLLFSKHHARRLVLEEQEPGGWSPGGWRVSNWVQADGLYVEMFPLSCHHSGMRGLGGFSYLEGYLFFGTWEGLACKEHYNENVITIVKSDFLFWHSTHLPIMESIIWKHFKSLSEKMPLFGRFPCPGHTLDSYSDQGFGEAGGMV